MLDPPKARRESHATADSTPNTRLRCLITCCNALFSDEEPDVAAAAAKANPRECWQPHLIWLPLSLELKESSKIHFVFLTHAPFHVIMLEPLRHMRNPSSCVSFALSSAGPCGAQRPSQELMPGGDKEKARDLTNFSCSAVAFLS